MLRGLRNVILAQTALTAAAAIGFFLVQGQQAGLSALYGGAIALANSLLLARRVRRAGDGSASAIAMAMYLGAAQRFVLTLAGFALGMGLLKLPPLPQIAAFAVAQVGYVIGARGEQS